MFSLEEVIHFHDQAIERYGGSKGIRDFGGLDAALHRPWQTFAGEELYPTCFEKSAAILESIILNHAFVDGNKRIAFLLCESLLEHSGYTIEAETEIIYQFLVSVATGDLNFESITDWLRLNTQLISP